MIPVKLDGYQGSVNPIYYVLNYTTSGTLTTAPIKVARKVGYSLTISCPATGSPVGNVTLQVCNDEERVLDVADTNLVNWVPDATLTNALSGASVITLDDPQPMYRWMRLVYVPTSGSITATVKLHVKDYSGGSS